MNSDKILKIIDKDNKEIEFKILIVFKLTKTNKNYIVYTDNTFDENNNLNVYASIYYPNDLTKLEPIETEIEWNEIENRLMQLQKKDME